MINEPYDYNSNVHEILYEKIKKKFEGVNEDIDIEYLFDELQCYMIYKNEVFDKIE